PTLPLTGQLPWRRIAVIGIEGFLDFQPQMAADALSRELGVETEVAYLHMPALDRLRNNPSEFRAVNIARVLDLMESLPPMAEELRRLAGEAEALFLPACLGLEDDASLAVLQDAVGKPIRLLPTLPPSVPGMR
ncbi:FAD-binding protein, partial [Enterobacteriaceae bacterium 8376wG6]|nr:FAD-binding protein [Enterobacteriaceae bacterium 8376wG6]